MYSCGARVSHLDVQVACEIDKVACVTYERNRTEKEMYSLDIYYFLTKPDNHEGCELDVTRLSPAERFTEAKRF